MKTGSAVAKAVASAATKEENGTAAAPPAAQPHSTLEVAFPGGPFLFAFIGTLILARPALVPMTAAALLAMTLMPAVNRLRQWGIPHVIAVTMVAIGVALVVFLVAWLLVEPLGRALNALPLLDGLGQ